MMTTQDWINEALLHTVVSIGQLDKPTIAALNRLVKKGLLSRGKGGPFPRLKTVYAVSGFDFAADRRRHVAEMMMWAKLDEKMRQARKAAV